MEKENNKKSIMKRPFITTSVFLAAFMSTYVGASASESSIMDSGFSIKSSAIDDAEKFSAVVGATLNADSSKSKPNNNSPENKPGNNDAGLVDAPNETEEETNNEEVIVDTPKTSWGTEIPVEAIYPFYSENEYTKINTRMTANEQGRACFSVEITGTSHEELPWAFSVDKNALPFTGNQISGGGADGRFNIEDRGSHLYITGTGALEKVSSNRGITFGSNGSFCARSNNGAPIMKEAVPASFTKHSEPTGNQWYATQQFKATNNSLYHSSWEGHLDLSELINHMGISADKAKVDVNTSRDIKVEHVKDSIWKISNTTSAHFALNSGKELIITVQAGQ